LKFFFAKTRLAAILVGTIYGKILKVIKNIDEKLELAANIKDIDKAIEEYDKAIEVLNKLIEETEDDKIKENLKNTKKEIEQSLADLTKIRDRINKNNKEKCDDK
jgi:tetratricopeptide (TPR) repeat protein